MSFTFKQFSTFIDEATEDKSPEQLDEIFGRLFGKKPDESEALTAWKKEKLLKQRTALLKSKELETEKQRLLRKASDAQWTKAKHNIEGNLEKIVAPVRPGRKDDYPFHHMYAEAKAQVGFFDMSDTVKIQKMDLDGAKTYLHSKIKRANGAKPANIAKAVSMVNKATSMKKLMIDVSNFILAHENGGFKVI